MIHTPCPHCLETTAIEDLHTLSSGDSVCPDCATTTTIYCARWKEYGGGWAEAESMEALQVKVFGQAYAPSRSSVSFTSRQCKQEDS